MFKRRLITTASLVLALIVGAIVDTHAGFAIGYFAISIAMVLSLYWSVEFIIDLVCFYIYYQDDYNIYIAEKVNKTKLTYEEIKERNKQYLKEFKRSRWKGKFYGYMKIFFAFGIFIFFLTSLF